MNPEVGPGHPRCSEDTDGRRPAFGRTDCHQIGEKGGKEEPSPRSVEDAPHDEIRSQPIHKQEYRGPGRRPTSTECRPSGRGRPGSQSETHLPPLPNEEREEHHRRVAHGGEQMGDVGLRKGPAPQGCCANPGRLWQSTPPTAIGPAAPSGSRTGTCRASPRREAPASQRKLAAVRQGIIECSDID